MVSIDDLKDLMMYKKPFFLPVVEKDKRRGSSIMLLTPNYKSSMLAMTAPYSINRRYFESYYVEKSITRYIVDESVVEMEDLGEYVFEATLSSKQRNDLDDSDFGIPELRKYPMPDKNHVLAAIKFFNHVEDKYEKELADNIIKKIKKFDMASEIKVGDKNRFKPYWEKSGLAVTNESYLEEINLPEEFYNDYFDEFVSTPVIKAADEKTAVVSNLVFSGYQKDIDQVKKYFNSESGKIPFKKLNLKAPKKINVIVTGDPNVEEEITKDSLIIYTPGAMKNKGYQFDYKDYIAFVMQLFAIYSIDTSVGVRVYDNFAEPLAILLSGIADKEIAKDRNKDDGYNQERVWKYIIDKYGVNEVVRILRTNNMSLLMAYAKEYYGITSESALDIDDETVSLYEADSAAIDVPESMKQIQKMASSLKRRIRQHSVYKLNKIKRDLERGNTGVETRGTNTIQQLKTGNVSGISLGDTTGTTEQVERWTNGDYIVEGNVLYLFEDNINYDTILRKALFKDRFRTNKDILEVYKEVRADLPFIKYTYVDLFRYANKNLFVDLSHYNESFFRNLDALNDEDKTNSVRMFKIYAELMDRLITDSNLDSYQKKTIFIPILDWRHNSSTRMWMFKEDLNPISVIYNYMKYDQTSLKKLFKDHDVIFMGAKNYFKINFSQTDMSKSANQIKFINMIKRIVALGYNSPADPDPEGEMEYSPTGIAMDIIDKVERSQNVTIDDVSKLSGLNKDINLFAAKDKAIDVATGATSVAIKNNIVASTRANSAISTEKDGKLTTRDRSKSFSGRQVTVPVEVDKQNVTLQTAKAATKQETPNKAVNDPSEDEKKDAIVDAIAKVANDAKSVDDALDKLNQDEFKNMIASLSTNSEDNIRVDKARASKIVALEDEFHEKEVAGKSVKEMLNSDPAKEELPKTALKVKSINTDWNHVTFTNFDKTYDPDADMMKMLDSMKNWTFPIAIKNIEVTDNSTSEDYVNLWKIDCIDYKGTRFTLKVDIPKFVEGTNFLKLRGNEKSLMIQSSLIPIIKSGLDECQIIGSGGYNKIFVRRFGARKGQSMPSTNKLIRTLNKYSKPDIKIIPGDNTSVCSKYELPIDYIDIASCIDTIDSGKHKFFFNPDEFRTQYQVDDTKGIALGIERTFKSGERKAVENIIYYDEATKKNFSTIAGFIGFVLSQDSDSFADYYNNLTTAGARYTYSKASILSTEIPVVIVCGYLEGLVSTMEKGRIAYQFVQELDKSMKYNDRYDYIKFSDGYLVYEVNYSSSLLMNGLKENDTESYSIKDCNNRRMYLEFLENYGGSLRSDGLENSYDCMIDPITKEILTLYKLPTDYVSVMLHASNLLADNKYVKHIDQSGRRWRRKELVAGYFYKALSTAYQEYANSIRHNRKNSKMTIKQSAVIDLMLSKDPATSDLSINNVVNDVECANTVTNKGLVGMNNQRAYSVGTRTYDESMLNVLGMDTAFSGTVGINRQATIDANVEGGRGLIKTIDGDTDKLSVAKTLTITEAVTPFGSTHDDPQRTLMTFLQTSKHMIRCENNDPTLITNGADEALPYLASNIFSYKAAEDGKVVEIVNDGSNEYMIVEYKSGKHEYVNLKEEIKKNSDGGYFVPLKLDTDLAVGARFKSGDVLAYDKLSFSNSLGESGNLAANIGTLAKVAIINTDEGFEDSAAVTETFADKIGTPVIMSIETVIDKGSNVFVYKSIGDYVMEGDTLLAYQTDFDDEVANTLLKNLTVDKEQLSELGRTPVKSKYTGFVAGIEIYRTAEMDELSPSLKAFVNKYESGIRKKKAVYSKYGIDASSIKSTDKVEQIGKAKNVNDAVKVIYYIKYIDKLSVGDKIVFYSANKGIVKYIIPKDQEPYTDFRPTEHIDSFMSLSSISGRMTWSSAEYVAVSKLLVELDRSVKDIAGIPYDVSKL